MKRCPITYEVINDSEHYSKRGLKQLAPQLRNLKPLPLTAVEQRQEAVARASKMSLQGVQPKFSAKLKISEQRFEIVDQFGQFILKPQNEYYAELPENEALSMTLAAALNIEVPVHGLIYGSDQSFTYFIKRFDRYGKNQKLAVEDFSQLTQQSRETKYASSMERIAKVLETYCTFPKIEAIKLFELTLFNFLIGNEDMHLKNFSLIRRNGKVELAPAYDLLNTTIAQPKTREELALPLTGKKANLTKKDFIDYFAGKQLGLNTKVITDVLERISLALPTWKELIKVSFLSESMQEKYLRLLAERSERLGI